MTSTRDIKYSYDGCPSLRDFARSDAFIRAILGPIGSGKSSASVVELISRGMAQRPGPDGIRRTRFAVVRNTWPELRDTTIKTVFQWLPPQYFGRYTSNDHRYVIKALDKAEIEILFIALDRPDDVKKLLSLELTGAWINEAREMPWAIIDMLQGRVGRYPSRLDGGCSWFGIWMDTNPPDSDSKFYKFFEEGAWLPSFRAMMENNVLPANTKPEDFAAIFRQPSGFSADAENVPNLPAGYYHRLAIGKSKEWVDVYIKAEYGFVSDGKAVYPEYNDKVHCRSADPVRGKTIIRSYDFGLTPACIFSQILPDGRWLVFDEMTSDNMGIDRFSDDVISHCARSFPKDVTFEDYGDPAGEQRAQTDERTCFEIMQNKGIMIEGSEQNPQLRIESVKKSLRTLLGGEPQFILHPRCRQLRKGFLGGYSFRRMQVSSERYTDQPEKNLFSHPHDALQYAAVKLFGSSLTRPRGSDDDFPQRGYEGSDAGRSTVTGY